MNKLSIIILILDFRKELLLTLNRGIIYCYPHIRGSKDLDNEWYKNGSSSLRLNSVNDLIDVARVFFYIPKVPHLYQ